MWHESLSFHVEMAQVSPNDFGLEIATWCQVLYFLCIPCDNSSSYTTAAYALFCFFLYFVLFLQFFFSLILVKIYFLLTGFHESSRRNTMLNALSHVFKFSPQNFMKHFQKLLIHIYDNSSSLCPLLIFQLGLFTH